MNGLTFKQTLNIIRKAFAISFKTKTKLSMVISLLGLVMALSAAFTSILLRDFTNQIQEIATGTGENLNLAFMLFCALVAVFLISEIYAFISTKTTINNNIRVKRYIDETIINNSCDIEYKYIDNYDKYKDKISFAGTQAGVKVAESITSVFVWVRLIITFASIVVLLAAVDIWIVLIILVSCIPATILAYFQKDESYNTTTKYMTEGNLVIHYYNICAGEGSMAEVRSLRLLDFLKTRWRLYAEKYIKRKNAVTRKHVLYNSAADILRNAVYIGILLIAANRIYQNPVLGLGVFMLVFTLTGQLQGVTAQMFINIANFMGDIRYMKDFLDIVEMETESFDAIATPLENANISFKNVTFTYPNGESPVLKDVSVQIKDGEKIAVVGENGSGKTTFINLLCGMYQPDRGEIAINDKSIFEYLTTVRRSISAVFQNFGRYEDTMMGNITLSDRNKPVIEEEILSIAKDMDFIDCISAQPDGLDEVLGTFSKHGNNLSGGQWQKLAICRAIYRDKAKIMILDEPTAALDPIAETNLYKNFGNLTGDKTTILISHRLGITSLVDRVIVFRAGRIVEDGSHAKLLADDGYYAELYNAQAKWYQ
ncbi:MAG: ABC transporter ATP-binding protein/permease [Defluviitaleaceae bacterium]|nr:ABC transporter ATP-binding protein/permease [Defluviitaleaceae bacterium]